MWGFGSDDWNRRNLCFHPEDHNWNCTLRSPVEEEDSNIDLAGADFHILGEPDSHNLEEVPHSLGAPEDYRSLEAAAGFHILVQEEDSHHRRRKDCLKEVHQEELRKEIEGVADTEQQGAPKMIGEDFHEYSHRTC